MAGSSRGPPLTPLRHRELLPIPHPGEYAKRVLEQLLPLHTCTALDKLVTDSVKALNFMYTGRRRDLVDKPLNRSQHSSVDSLVHRWFRLAHHLGREPSMCNFDPLAFQRLVSKGGEAKV